MARIDEIGRDPCLLKQLVDRNPEHAGRFHRHRVDATCNEPGDQGMQIDRKGRKHADRLRVAIRWDGNYDFFAADIQTSGIGVDTSEVIEGALLMRTCY